MGVDCGIQNGQPEQKAEWHEWPWLSSSGNTKMMMPKHNLMTKFGYQPSQSNLVSMFLNYHWLRVENMPLTTGRKKTFYVSPGNGQIYIWWDSVRSNNNFSCNGLDESALLEIVQKMCGLTQFTHLLCTEFLLMGKRIFEDGTTKRRQEYIKTDTETPAKILTRKP